MEFYLNLPYYAEMGVAVVCSVLLTWLLMLLVHKLVPYSLREANNDLTAFVFSSLGIFSALIISTVLVMAIAHFDAASEAVGLEANMIGDLNRAGRGVSPEFSKGLSEKVRDYMKIVSVLEWDKDNHAQNALKEREAINQLSRYVASFQPKTAREASYQHEMIKRLGNLYDARRNRASQTDPAIPPQLFMVSVLIGVLTLVFALLYGASNRLMHLGLVSLLAVAMGVTYSLILVFDAPFNGDLVASNQPYLDILDHLEKNNKFFQK